MSDNELGGLHYTTILRLILNKEVSNETMDWRDECTAKSETPSGPAEYDEEEEEMIWDTVSGEMAEKQKIG